MRVFFLVCVCFCGFFAFGESENKLNCKESFLKSADQVSELLKQGKEGDTQALFDLSLFLQNNHQLLILQGLTEAAQKGHPEAQYHLAKMYALGHAGYGVNQDLQKALPLFRDSAKQGAIESMYWTSRTINALFEEGKLEKEHLAEGLDWMKKASRHGVLDAHLFLGWAYIDHDNFYNITPNHKKAVYFFKKAAEHGVKEAMYNLGILFETGVTGEKNIDEAFKWFKKAADHGDGFSQYKLSSLYTRGSRRHNIEPDPKLAAQFMEQAAREGVVSAKIKLAILLLEGKNVQKDVMAAIEWLEEASEEGDLVAKNLLAQTYVDLAPEKAVELFREAIEEGSEDAMNGLGVLYEEGRAGLEQDHEKAFYWIKKSSDLNNPEAQYNLGLAYGFKYESYHIDQNLELAFELLTKSVEQFPHSLGYARIMQLFAEDNIGTQEYFDKAFEGLKRLAQEDNDPEAQHILAQLYERGIFGVSENVQQAFYFYRRAALSGLKDAKTRLTVLLQNRPREVLQKI